MTKEEGKLKCFDVAYLEQITEELLHYEVEPKTIYRGVPIDDFISLVKRMREAQKDFNNVRFINKSSDTYKEAKKSRTQLESEVDEWLKKMDV